MSKKSVVENFEKQGRDAVVNTFGSKYAFIESPERYDCWDLSGQTATNKNYFLEVKARQCVSDDYETALCEVKKWVHLTRLAEKYNADIHFVCTYLDGKLYSFPLNELPILDFKQTIKWVLDETCYEEDEERWVRKLFFELPMEYGKEFKIKS